MLLNDSNNTTSIFPKSKCNKQSYFTRTFPQPHPYQIEFSGQTGAVQIPEMVVQIHANDMLNIGIGKFGKFGMSGAG